ncbi:MAG: calcium-binding protein [Bacteroidota bacterium]
MNNQEIQNFLYDEVLVDAYGPEEQLISWFYFAEEELKFPFTAEVAVKKTNGTTESKKVVVEELVGFDGTVAHPAGLKVEIAIGENLIEKPLSSLNKVEDLGRNQKIIEA